MAADSPMRRTRKSNREQVGVLVASGGGHLLQLAHLAKGLPECKWIWVTFATSDATHLLEGRCVVYAHHPTNRNVGNLMRNTLLAWRIMRRTRPRIVISTGAGVAVPFLWIGRILGCRVIYVESYARTRDLSLTGKLVRPVVHRVFVQWPAAQGARRVEYKGSIF